MPPSLDERIGWLIVSAVVLGFFLHWLIGKAPWIERQKKILRQILWLLVVLAVLLGALATAGIDVTTILAGLGVGGLALAFALKDVLANVVAGFLLLGQRSFRAGDRVAVGGHEGTLLETDMRYTTLRTDDGDVVHVPNQVLLGQTVVKRAAAPDGRDG